MFPITQIYPLSKKTHFFLFSENFPIWTKTWIISDWIFFSFFLGFGGAQSLKHNALSQSLWSKGNGGVLVVERGVLAASPPLGWIFPNTDIIINNKSAKVLYINIKLNIYIFLYKYISNKYEFPSAQFNKKGENCHLWRSISPWT